MDESQLTYHLFVIDTQSCHSTLTLTQNSTGLYSEYIPLPTNPTLPTTDGTSSLASDPPSKPGNDAGMIAGIVIGVILFLAIVSGAIIAFLMLRRRRKQREREASLIGIQKDNSNNNSFSNSNASVKATELQPIPSSTNKNINQYNNNNDSNNNNHSNNNNNNSGNAGNMNNYGNNNRAELDSMKKTPPATAPTISTANNSNWNQIEEVTIENRLGGGNFSDVYKGNWQVR